MRRLWRRRDRPHGLSLLLALLIAWPAAGQSLSDAARKEKERRAKPGKVPARVFTDEDLYPNANPSPAPAASPTPAPTPSPDEEAAKRRALELAWRERFARARERAAAAERNAWREELTVDFVAGIPIQRYVKVFEETDELRQAKQALVDLEDELRRAGLPAGWGRE